VRGIKLKEAGFDNLFIFEKAAKVGGTWRDNTYPGCLLPTFKSRSISSRLRRAWTGVIFFPRHFEVQKYTEDLADNFGLRPHLHLNEETESAVWTRRARFGKSPQVQASPTIQRLSSPH